MEMPVIRCRRRWSNAPGFQVFAGILFLISAPSLLPAASLSDPAVDAYDVRVGTETFAAMYKFTTNSALVETAQAVTPRELKQARRRIQPLFSQPIPQDKISERSIRLYLALKKIVTREEWGFYTIQSFPGLASHYCATCFAQSMMLEDGWGTSTLGDFNTAMTVKLLTDLSKERVYYGDLQHIDKASNEIKIIGDGACPPSLAGQLGPAGFATHGIPTEGEAGGLSVSLTCKVGEGVLARLGRNDGRFEMVLTRAAIFEPPAGQLQRRQNECGIPFWPHGFVTAHCDINAMLEAWNNEYACLGYGAHLYDDLAAFCEQTGIKAIAL